MASDTSSPYSYTWTNVAAGSYQLTAVARDDDGATRTSAVANITVSTTPNQLPTVSITSPISGQSFAAPASLTITAAASDSDGSIAKVEFYAGSQLIATDTTSQYQAAWSNVAAGSYSLTGRCPRQPWRHADVGRRGSHDHGGCTHADEARLHCLRRSCDQRDLVYRRDLSRRGCDHDGEPGRHARHRQAHSGRAATSRSTSRRSSIRCRPEPTRPSCARRVQEARPPARRRRRSRSSAWLRAHGSRLRRICESIFSRVFLEPEP